MKGKPSKQSESEKNNPQLHIEPVPTDSFPIVGIGASAGGLDALRTLFGALPVDSGMAFVVVQHLSPTHESHLTEILQQTTKMPVIQVEDEPAVLPNTIYVIPPNRHMTVDNRHLKLEPRPKTPPGSHSVNAFFEALARDIDHRAIGVILSGTGSDGTLGLECIKAAGGFTFAQDETAEHVGMPRSAVASGSVDYVLAPAEIAKELIRIGLHPELVDFDPNTASIRNIVQRIIRMLHEANGVDFTNYRFNSIYRRITRRLLLHKLDTMSDYVVMLRGNSQELRALQTDILINVTSFFRDPEAFEILKTTVFPNLMKARKPGEPIRVWTMGCSTGEEAYSLAIIISEVAEELGIKTSAQIYATDLNEVGVEHARGGSYSKSIRECVSSERLVRFFTELEGGYVVKKSIRDMCIFAQQNVLTDPPFSRMDFISCRNMLIYMEPVLQQRVIPLFHYALLPEGFLWLGSSETIGNFTNLFSTLDAKTRVYGKRPVPTPLDHHVSFSTPIWELPVRESHKGKIEQIGNVEAYREADRIAIGRYTPPAVLIDQDFEIIQYRGDTSQYLSQTSGRPTKNLLKIAREGLMVGIRHAVKNAVKENTYQHMGDLRVKFLNNFYDVEVEVFPVAGSGPDGYYLVSFAPPGGVVFVSQTAENKAAGTLSLEQSDQEVHSLSQELASTREFLQSMVEQQDSANEELQSANEEIQSSNEELQSINEELQTSKEEIQSANEELTTVNDELRNRNDQLNLANSDLINFLGSINQAVVMLGPDLRIRRFTPTAEKMLNLLHSDIGRPFSNINLPFEGIEIEERLPEVIENVTTYEQEIQDRRGRWFLLRIRPYKTLDNRIDGAVLVLVDIESQKRSQVVLAKSRDLLHSIVTNLPRPLLILDSDLKVTLASKSYYQKFMTEPELTEGVSIFSMSNGQWNIPELRKLLENRLRMDGDLDEFEVDVTLENIGKRTLLLGAKRFHDEDSGEWLILLSLLDFTARKEATDALNDADHRKDEFLAMLAHELRNPLSVVSHGLEVLHQSKNLDETNIKQTESMSRQIAQINVLIDDLLDVSRIATGQIRLDRKPVNLTKLTKETAQAQNAEARIRQVQIKTSIAREPIFVLGDQIRLEQIVSNILNNAIKYNSIGGTVEVMVEPIQDTHVSLKVRDTGKGIDPENLEKLFDLFYRVDYSVNRQTDGLGIGLSLVRQIVDRLGGTVLCRSEGLGKGSEFEVLLPVIDAPESTQDSQSPAKGSDELSPQRILIVDDNRDGANILGVLLGLHGHTAETANSGEDGLAKIGEFKPTVVLVDIGMPIMDGYEFARRVRANRKLAKVVLIAVTGYGRESHLQAAIDAGFSDLAIKPVEIEHLLKIIATMLNKDANG